jgi:hypothetical protein
MLGGIQRGELDKPEADENEDIEEGEDAER